MKEKSPITVSVIANAPIEKVWECFTKPEHIPGWAFAQDDWEASDAENDLRVGGRFKTTMSAKDGSASFDFTGTYTAVKEYELIEYDMDEALSLGGDSDKTRRRVRVEFEETPKGIRVTETFDPEDENPIEMQRTGWQAILNNFKKYVENM